MINLGIGMHDVVEIKNISVNIINHDKTCLAMLVILQATLIQTCLLDLCCFLNFLDSLMWCRDEHHYFLHWNNTLLQPYSFHRVLSTSPTQSSSSNYPVGSWPYIKHVFSHPLSWFWTWPTEFISIPALWCSVSRSVFITPFSHF